MNVIKQFTNACKNGNLNKAQKLLQLNPEIIVSEYPFQLACENGHLPVAQWLFQIKPTIDVKAVAALRLNNVVSFTCARK